jgi:SAM-dependent methyltransferase
MPTDPTQRFSDRVDNYVRYRPSYPVALLQRLQKKIGLPSASAIADVGSGTGLLTELLLPMAHTVFAVEPNVEMRDAAERQLRGRPGFVSVDGSAEATPLSPGSIDLITVAQAFHWFDPVATRREFTRVLKPGGWVALLWNERLTDSPFLAEYEALLKQRAVGYDQVKHSRIEASALAAFFSPRLFEELNEPNEQAFDLAALEGRTLSSSYVPNVGQPGHDAFMTELRALFARHVTDGRVQFRYQTRLYLGQL